MAGTTITRQNNNVTRSLSSLCLLTIITIVVGIGIYFYFYRLNNATSEVEEKMATEPVATAGNAAVLPPSLQGTAALQLGTYGTSPWGSISKFIDLTAQWIWNLQTAAVEAPKTPVKFSNYYNNDSSTNLEAVLHIIVDNTGTIFINGTEIKKVEGGWDTVDYPKVPVTLKPGYNIIDIVAENVDGPAGIVLALVQKDNGKILLKSDSNWKTTT